MGDAPILSPGGWENDVEGLRVPSWMPGDDDFAERLQVSIVWHPAILINGHEVIADTVPMPTPDLYAVTARVFRKEVVANRERELATELEAVTAGLGMTVDEFAKLTLAALEAALRRALERRGFPVP